MVTDAYFVEVEGGSVAGGGGGYIYEMAVPLERRGDRTVLKMDAVEVSRC